MNKHHLWVPFITALGGKVQAIDLKVYFELTETGLTYSKVVGTLTNTGEEFDFNHLTRTHGRHLTDLVIDNEEYWDNDYDNLWYRSTDNSLKLV